ncbi:MAG: thioredoxin domain-containing protein [Methanotrichaceae archaeon]|nr:thioredoxin domain-containing protein [Methanotrichaceae archaeon]
MNDLAGELSPYLLQHANDPVDWHPWGEEAFEKARREDKPIFLSIGYSACHWCHVMARESFQNPDVARLLNGEFVSIKVDREERPDIDGIYMSACQEMTGQGGWPLSIFMTPEGRPFLATTYIPGPPGRGSLLGLLPQITEMWKGRRGDLYAYAEALMARMTEGPADRGEMDLEMMHQAFGGIARSFDWIHGGFGKAPKFPNPNNILFLLRYWKRYKDATALDMAETALDAMRRGGIFDQVGFGFHRYSTDAEWSLPHFEKMLCDQALLEIAYLEAYQATGLDAYARTAREILEYVKREMTSPEGGFYSAEDADSDGEEGAFYIWSPEEFEEALGPQAKPMMSLYGISCDGNVGSEGRIKRGRNVPRVALDPKEVPEDFDPEYCRRTLLRARDARVHPPKDDKILTDGNGLMIAALARAAWTLNDRGYEEMAERAAEFLMREMYKNGALLHRYRLGVSGIEGKLDDYAFLIWGLIELYLATFKGGHLEMALDLSSAMVDLFWDGRRGGFFFTAEGDKSLIIREKVLSDGSNPSGNAVAAWNLLRLSKLTGRLDLEALGREALQTSLGKANLAASAQAMIALDFAMGPNEEIVIAGPRKEAIHMAGILRSRYLPRSVISLADEGATEIAEDIHHIPGEATAHICSNRTCQPPTTDREELLRRLG